MEIVALPSLLDALLDPLLAPLLPYVFLLYMLFSISWPAFTVNEGPEIDSRLCFITVEVLHWHSNIYKGGEFRSFLG